MYFIMKSSYKVCFLCVILLTLTKGVFLSTCEFSNLSESISKEENSSININYTINITTSPDVTDEFNAEYTVCERNIIIIPCMFYYYKKIISEFKKDLSGRTGVTCYWEQRQVSSSVVALDINISQVVTRSLRGMIFSTGRGGIPRPTRRIRVEVLYPPKVRNLFVDGEDIAGPHFINEGQNVKIPCTFDKGNPPATFKLLDKHGHELKSAVDEGHLNYSLTAQCEDDLSIVRCEGSESKQNKSVTFFVRCPPHFIDKSIKIVNLQTFQVITFRVKAHTTTLMACLLTPVALDNNDTRGVSCILSGHPPDLLLTVHLHKETNISQGNWSLILRNEAGFARTTLMIIYDPATVIQFVTLDHLRLVKMAVSRVDQVNGTWNERVAVTIGSVYRHRERLWNQQMKEKVMRRSRKD